MITILDKPVPFGGGITLPSYKAISLQHPLRRAAIPELLKIPLRQHVGLPAIPVVKVGERVLKGQAIAEQQGYISAPIHAGTSGVIKAIEDHPLPNPSGAESTCIVIETDGKDEPLEKLHQCEDFYDLNPLELQKRIFEAGIVGLGGAGFPSAVKLIPGLSLDIELLIINAAECEPYITCDETLIRNYAKDLITGIEILAHALQVDDCVIAIEDNKSEAIEQLSKALEQYAEIPIRLMQVSSLYPAGGEKQIIKSITGLDVPAGGLPVDIGVVCYNVGTTYAVKKAILDNESLISRIMTVTGAGINKACNLDVLIGTPINDVIKECGGYSEQFDYLIMGGPMMGFRLHSDAAPVIKTTNCLLAVVKEDTNQNIAQSPCIRCDECAEVCPANLQPQQLHWHSNEFNMVRLQDYRLFECIECGCCSYVCPSHISLVDEYRQAKSRIWNYRRKQMETEHNKQRYLDKQDRLIQQAEQKNRKNSGDVEEPIDTDNVLKRKREEIAAAVRRVKEKRKSNERQE